MINKEKRLTEEQVLFFENQGYLEMTALIDQEQVAFYQNIYEDFLNGKIDAKEHRSDLSGLSNPGTQKEKITQIMRPSLLVPSLLSSPYYQKALQAAQQLLGADIALDFDMLIDKAPHTNTPTPWHQDEAYWLDMPDKRAATCWLALDEVEKENGCMWFVPQSHQLPLRKHRQTGKGGALECDAQEAEGVAVPLAPGSCTFHHGGVLHYSRGNSTARRRRAFILNFRPQAMIQLEREKGYDHLGKRTVKNNTAK